MLMRVLSWACWWGSPTKNGLGLGRLAFLFWLCCFGDTGSVFPSSDTRFKIILTEFVLLGTALGEMLCKSGWEGSIGDAGHICENSFCFKHIENRASCVTLCIQSELSKNKFCWNWALQRFRFLVLMAVGFKRKSAPNFSDSLINFVSKQSLLTTELHLQRESMERKICMLGSHAVFQWSTPCFMFLVNVTQEWYFQWIC